MLCFVSPRNTFYWIADLVRCLLHLLQAAKLVHENLPIVSGLQELKSGKLNLTVTSWDEDEAERWTKNEESYRHGELENLNELN
jgi:hypothetical protein